MNSRSAALVTAVVLTLAFCAFVLIHEKRALVMAQSRIDTHARIIAEAVWNYNHQGVQEYLRLAAFSDHYESLIVTHSNGERFQEIHHPPDARVDQLLIALHLIPRIPLNSRIQRDGAVIGHVAAVWLSTAVYTDSYVMVAMGLIFVIVQLYLRLLRSKGRLEERVKTRTAALTASNRELLQEIEERTRAEAALRDSEQRHRLLAENISDIIWIMDLDWRFTYISPVGIRVLGWTATDLQTMTAERIMTPESFRSMRREVLRQLAAAEHTANDVHPLTMELAINQKNGSTVLCEVTASFLVGENGVPASLLGVVRDITERRRAEKEKADLQRQLERSKKMESLGLLAGGVAHDLNNVLSGIVSYPDLLLMDLPETSAMRAPVEVIRESGQRAATIVQDLLTLARRGVTAREVINLNTLIDTLRRSAEYRHLCTRTPGIRFRFDLAEDLPNIRGSSVHLDKSVMNLLANAVDAQPGGGEIAVSTRSRYMERPIKGYDTIAAGEYVRLRVRDCGEGIGQGDLNHIFEPFYTKKKMGRSGTGLGLAVVWGTVQDHTGYVDVNSTPGEGTTFDLYFPLCRETVAEKTPRATLEELQGHGQTILVVDDLESQRRIAAHLLKRLNYTPHTVDSGEAALAWLETHTADLVLLDMIMEPGMDGLDTWRRIITIRPGQRAVIASGYAETEKVRTAQRLGAGEYLKKPYLIDNLGMVIQRALGPCPPDNR